MHVVPRAGAGVAVLDALFVARQISSEFSPEASLETTI